MTTSGSFNLLGNDGRCSIIGVEIGFNNLTASNLKDTQTKNVDNKNNNSQSGNAGSPHGNSTALNK